MTPTHPRALLTVEALSALQRAADETQSIVLADDLLDAKQLLAALSAEVEHWRSLHTSVACRGLNALAPDSVPPVWPRPDAPQDVAMVAFALHRAEARCEGLEALRRVERAARDYYMGYAQDEAHDEISTDGFVGGRRRGVLTGCSETQRDAARELRDALAELTATRTTGG